MGVDRWRRPLVVAIMAPLRTVSPRRGYGCSMRELMTFMPGAATLVSASGYQHHLGFNVWRGEGVPPVPEGGVGLRHWTVVLEDAEDVAAVGERVRAAGIAGEEREGGLLVRDPWGIPVHFVTPECLAR